MDSIQELEIERVCRDLITRFCLNFDSGGYSDLAKLFGPVGECARPSGLLNGRDEITKFLDSQHQPLLIRHISTNVPIRIVNGQNANAVSYGTVYRDPNPPTEGPGLIKSPNVIVEYKDSFVHLAEGWFFSRRLVMPIFQGQ